MNAPQPDGPRSLTPLRLAAAAWLIGFTIYFFGQPLPNLHFTRPAFWSEATWQIVDALSTPAPDPHQPPPPPSGWRFFPQRFENIFWGSLILVGAWHLGSLILRMGWRKPHTDRPEAPPMPPGVYFCVAGLLGLSAWSLIVLGMGLAGVLLRPAMMGLLCGFVLLDWIWERRKAWRPRILSTVISLSGSPPRLAIVCLAVMTPFLMAMALGSLLPSIDFDVKEYHLEGPKEWYQAGQITFLPHNVYTSFPFLTEMLLLSGMVLCGDWFEGGMAGQLVLASFGAYAAIAVFHIAARFSRRAGWLAAFIYLTTPWVCRISIIAYVEGALAAYLAAGLLAFLESRRDPSRALAWTHLCGLFAGSAASCKYPGVISALIPFGCLVVYEGFVSSAGSRIRSAISRGVLFSLAGLVAFGPWLLKNLVQTGNPVYPLLWDLFGGGAFDAQLNAKFKAGHPLPIDVLKNPLRWIPDLWQQLNDVAVGSDWQSPLMFGLAPAAVCVWWSLSRRQQPDERTANRQASDLLIIQLYAVWLFLTWWALTHRIDRFWVPMLSIIAALSGVALDWILGLPADSTDARKPKASLPLTIAVIVILAATTWYHLGFIASPLVGFNGYLMNEAAARRVAEKPTMTIINSLPEDSRTLLIGEAEVFEARRPVIYSTVFNHNVFEQLFAAEDGQSMKPPMEIKQILKDRGITHILANWNEVLRYRDPGSYGYSEFVTPEHVYELEKQGLIVPEPLPRNVAAAVKVDDQGDSRRRELSTWGQALIQADPQGNWYPAYELWRVVD